MGGGNNRYICWDLDKTLGRFDPQEAGKRGLTRGISVLLEELQGQGLRHVVTTAAASEYAEGALDEFGIRGRFDAVFDRSVICDNRFNKHYLPVASRLGIRQEEAAERIIVIGNSMKDAPADSDIVFIHHPSASYFDAAVIRSTLGYLGSFPSWTEAQEALFRVPNPLVSYILTEAFETEKLLLDIAGPLSALEGGISVMGCQCSISYVPNGAASEIFEREVRRLVSIYSIDAKHAAEVDDGPQQTDPGFALAVNQ